MSSCQSTPDTSADYVMPGGQIPAPTVTVTTFLNAKLANSAPEFARADCGSEALARVLTTFCSDLFKSGELKREIVIPRSKIESVIATDGNERVKALANIKLKGMNPSRPFVST